ncbi:hypothetical protein N9K05_01500 [Woeseiaceae bacterium]|nr:hypothetical protein [Woeseiaceae bacterium]|tara:strand:- start:778 stop:1449 length:672 start_codon:yes stop_codon:yes gene_type:complete
MINQKLWCIPLALFFIYPSYGLQHSMSGNHSMLDHHSMSGDNGSIVMNANHHNLPLGCERISGEKSITVKAAQRYAKEIPGSIFGMNEHEWKVEPCTRVTVTFINEDDVRHQWMVHGLPKYLYPAGMFHIESMAGKTTTGTFIVPSENRNYLVHCDMAQHMEMGMRGQLVVGEGNGDLWAVTGITEPFYRASYLPDNLIYLSLIVLFLGYSLTSWLVRLRQKR